MLSIAFIEYSDGVELIDIAKLDKTDKQLADFYLEQSFMFLDPITGNFSGKTPTQQQIYDAYWLATSCDTFRKIV